MTKREQYGLVFQKNKNTIDGSDVFFCRKPGKVDKHDYLKFFLNQLDDIEVKGLRDDLDEALKGNYYEEYFVSDGIPDSIHLKYPNVTFEYVDLTLPMVDLKALLQEWLDFINQ